MGWPMGFGPGSFSGAFLYHLENNQVAVGLIVDLGYKNPHISPFDELQRVKHHPLFAPTLEGGKRVSYGARAIIKGGLPALPELTFPGGMLVGDDAGFLNMLKIKGTHTGMKSGMLAAEAVMDHFTANSEGGGEVTTYQSRFENSWLHEELHRARNAGPAFHKLGILGASPFLFLEQKIAGGNLPLTLKDPTPDHAALKPASACKKPDYPKPDGVLSFDKLSSVFLSNTNHEARKISPATCN